MIFKLNNNLLIPSPGFGTYGLGGSADTIQKIKLAAKCGYRHFDTAIAYNNESDVGEALEFITGNICPREDCFITSKISNEALTDVSDGYTATKNSFSSTLEKLRTDYLDLYLIHWPVPRYAESTWKELNKSTWLAMEELYQSGKIRAIGLSNFTQRHIENILSGCTIKPMVNQIEIQPLYQQRGLIKYCQELGIVVEAWGPLKQGAVFTIKEMQRLADKYGKSISQICLKFCLQMGVLPIVKSSNEIRMKENLDLNGWNLSAEDMQALFLLDTPDGRFQNYAYIRRDNC